MYSLESRKESFLIYTYFIEKKHRFVQFMIFLFHLQQEKMF